MLAYFRERFVFHSLDDRGVILIKYQANAIRRALKQVKNLYQIKRIESGFYYIENRCTDARIPRERGASNQSPRVECCDDIIVHWRLWFDRC